MINWPEPKYYDENKLSGQIEYNKGYNTALFDCKKAVSEAQPKPELMPLTEKDINNLKTYVEWHGGIHENDCPEDDTCDCKYKIINDSVNNICKGLFSQPTPAKPKERVELDEEELSRKLFINLGGHSAIECNRIAKFICSKLSLPKREVTVEDILEVLKPIPSTAYPICDINGKNYYYMCKEYIAQAIFDRMREGI